MREIKFRFWDSIHGIMSSTIHLGENSFAGVNLQRDIPMQYTGLKDKNGKEIYEGDIVRAYKPNSYLNEQPIAVVWDKDRAGFFYDNFFGKNRRYQVGNNRGGAYCEVIGNIYENPELLEDK